MNFDDYNYKSFNDIVLVEEPIVDLTKDDKKKKAKVGTTKNLVLNAEPPKVELKEELMSKFEPS